MSGKSMVSNGTSSESPYEDEENSYKNSQYILEVKESQEIRIKTEHILNHLQKEGIIKNPKIDRYDTKIVNDTDKSHYHFFYDLQGVNNKGSHNTLTKIINDYVESGTINNKLINKIKGDILKKNTITQKGILDTRHEGYDLTLQQKKLLKDNIDNFYYINKRGDKLFNFEHIEQDKALKGMSGTDKPINLIEGNNVKSLQGQYDYTFHFDKDLSTWEMEELLETKLKEQILKSGGSVEDFKGYDFDLTKMTITQKDNTINIKMNNLLKGVDSNNFYMISSKNMKLILEQTFKEVEKELDLNLNYRNRFYKDIEDINELMLDKSLKGTQLKTEIDPASPVEEIEQPQETPQEEKVVEQVKPQETQKETVKPIQIDLKEYETKTIEEVSTEIETQTKLKEEMTKFVEMSKMFGTYEDTKDKLELGLSNITSKIKQLEEVIETKQEEQRLENLEKEVETLKTDLVVKDKEVNDLISKLSSKDKEIETLKTDLETTETNNNILKTENEILVENYEELEIEISSKDTEIETLKTELHTKTKLVEVLETEVKELEEELTIKDTEIEKMGVEFIEKNQKIDKLSTEVKTQSKTIEVLKKDIENRDNNISIHKKNIKKLETDLTSKDTEIEDLKKQLEESQKKIIDLEETIEEEVLTFDKKEMTTPLSEEDKLIKELDKVEDTSTSQGNKHRTIEEPTEEDDDIIEVKPVNIGKLEVRFEEEEGTDTDEQNKGWEPPRQ